MLVCLKTAVKSTLNPGALIYCTDDSPGLGFAGFRVPGHDNHGMSVEHAATACPLMMVCLLVRHPGLACRLSAVIE